MKTMMQIMLSGRDKQSTTRLRKTKAQSLVEFAITLPVLLLLFSGLVEFGFALNYYLSLLDATRESARYNSNFDPFLEDGTDDMTFYSTVASMAACNLDPVLCTPSYQGRRIALDSATDNVIVTVFSWSDVAGITRYPLSGPYELYAGNTTTMFTEEEIASRFTAGEPNAGILLVEVHYNYRQVLALPWLAPFVPDPLLLRAYTIMPLAAAEPPE